MAPSFDIGRPERSLVRIPESGQDKSLDPVCLLLAEMSASRTLSVILNFDLGTSLSGRMSLSYVVPPYSATESSNFKRKSDQSSLRANERSVDEAPAAKRRFTSSAETQTKYLMKNNKLSSEERRIKFEKLQNLKKQLLQENEILQKKVARFREIILSRSQLKIFLQHLKEMDAQKKMEMK